MQGSKPTRIKNKGPRSACHSDVDVARVFDIAGVGRGWDQTSEREREKGVRCADEANAGEQIKYDEQKRMRCTRRR